MSFCLQGNKLKKMTFRSRVKQYNKKYLQNKKALPLINQLPQQPLKWRRNPPSRLTQMLVTRKRLQSAALLKTSKSKKSKNSKTKVSSSSSSSSSSPFSSSSSSSSSDSEKEEEKPVTESEAVTAWSLMLSFFSVRLFFFLLFSKLNLPSVLVLSNL